MNIKTIEEKIEYFKLKDKLTREILQGSHPEDVVELQTHILKMHTSIDMLMLEAVRGFIWSVAFNNQSPEKLELLNSVLFLSISEVAYKKKLYILNLVFSGLKSSTKNSINKLNILRNEFAHKELYILARKYNYSSDEGKNHILKAYEICDTANNGLIDDLETMEGLQKYSSYRMKQMGSE